MNEVQDRIEKVIKVHFDGNLNKACRELDIPQSSLINVVKGKRNKPSFDNILKMVSHPKYYINLQWLILGIGEISDNKSIVAHDIDTSKNDYKRLYEESKDEIIRLQAKINHLYELQISEKEVYPSAMGGVKGAKAS
jgi:hypothetical protein